jgi:hypothetical protein
VSDHFASIVHDRLVFVGPIKLQEDQEVCKLPWRAQCNGYQLLGHTSSIGKHSEEVEVLQGCWGSEQIVAGELMLDSDCVLRGRHGQGLLLLAKAPKLLAHLVFNFQLS